MVGSFAVLGLIPPNLVWGKRSCWSELLKGREAETADLIEVGCFSLRVRDFIRVKSLKSLFNRLLIIRYALTFATHYSWHVASPDISRCPSPNYRN